MHSMNFTEEDRREDLRREYSKKEDVLFDCLLKIRKSLTDENSKSSPEEIISWINEALHENIFGKRKKL